MSIRRTISLFATTIVTITSPRIISPMWTGNLTDPVRMLMPPFSQLAYGMRSIKLWGDGTEFEIGNVLAFWVPLLFCPESKLSSFESSASNPLTTFVFSYDACLFIYMNNSSRMECWSAYTQSNCRQSTSGPSRTGWDWGDMAPKHKSMKLEKPLEPSNPQLPEPKTMQKTSAYSKNIRTSPHGIPSASLCTLLSQVLMQMASNDASCRVIGMGYGYEIHWNTKNNILQLPTSWHFAYWHTIIWRFSVAMEWVLLLYHWYQHIPTMPPKFFSHTKSAASAGNSARVLLWNHYGSIRRCNQCGWPGTASGGAFFRDGTRTLPRLAKHGSLSLCRTSSTIINKYRCEFRFQGIVPEAKERQKINVLQFHSCGQKGDCLLLVQFDIFCLCRKTWKSRCRASRVTVLAAQLAIEQSTCSNLGCTWMDSMDSTCVTCFGRFPICFLYFATVASSADLALS